MDVEAAFEAAGYRIEAVIGRGGVGTVYRALQLSLQRDVALKLLTAEQSTDGTFRQMFLHTVDHSSYHRGQIVTMLRQLGVKPPSAGMMGFYRSR